VESKIPTSFGYLLRICELGDENDYCKMDVSTFVASMEKDVFVEETVVSSELGEGGEDVSYGPKKVRLFFWEGGLSEDYCRDECVEGESSLSCSEHFDEVRSRECIMNDTIGCFRYGESELNESCVGGDVYRRGMCGELV